MKKTLVSLAPWLLYLIACYGIWLGLVVTTQGFEQVINHWPIAATMALGSFVAGATPMGGGTVGFPVLVLLFEFPASLGRDFSFAIQAVGMTSASIFILVTKQKLATSLLKGALLGSLVGTTLGILFVAPMMSQLAIKIVFSVVWASFGLFHLYRLKEIATHAVCVSTHGLWHTKLGFYGGLLAGLFLVSVTGVGIDMIVYTLLVLICRIDIRVAIPTSVLVMAFNSLLGIAVKILFDGGLEVGVYDHWLAAAPIVLLGAPLGSLAIAKIGRRKMLVFVSLLCAFQFVWTLYSQYSQLGSLGAILAIVAVAICLFAFERLRTFGLRA